MVKETLSADRNFTQKENLFYQNDFQKSDFESAYIDIREKEGRLFSNSEVQTLPYISSTHPHYREWQIRKRSTTKLIRYLSQRSELKILEIGCGNGWLCNNLSQVPNSEVVGIDVNETELKQASDIFNNAQNLAFILGNIVTVQIPLKFDFIIFASSLQYFPNIESLFTSASKFLNANGEIHILDTPFYDRKNVSLAKGRSFDYFRSQNSKMQDHYFHHEWDTLSRYKPVLLYDPTSSLNSLKSKFTKDSPFPWIRIKKADNV